MTGSANKRIDNFIRWLVPALVGVIGTIGLLLFNLILVEIRELRHDMSKATLKGTVNEVRITNNEKEISELKNKID